MEYLNKETGKMFDVIVEIPEYKDSTGLLSSSKTYIEVHTDIEALEIIEAIEGTAKVNYFSAYGSPHFSVSIDIRYDINIVADNIYNAVSKWAAEKECGLKMDIETKDKEE